MGDKDKPEVSIEVKKKKKISRENLKSAIDVKIPSPDLAVKRKKKREPIVDDEIENPLFSDVPKEEKSEKKPELDVTPEEEKDEEEVEDVKVEHIVEPKKKLTKKDLKTSVKIKGLAQSEEKVRRRKPKEPLADETMEKKPSFEDIPHLPQEEPQLDKDKSKVRDQFTEKSKTTAVEESIVIEPTVLPEV